MSLAGSGHPHPEALKRNEWRLDDQGLLDDVVVDDVVTFRLERMGDDHVWGAVYHRDGSRTDFNIYGERLALEHEHESKAAASLSSAPPIAPSVEGVTVTSAELEWLRIALDGASKALPVLFTMLTKAGLRQGAMVADELNANIVTANRELAHLLERLRSTPRVGEPQEK